MSSSPLIYFFSAFPRTGELYPLCVSGRCAAQCVPGERPIILCRLNTNPWFLEGDKRGGRSCFPVSLAEPARRAPCPHPRRSCPFVCPGTMRRAGEEASTGGPRGWGLGRGCGRHRACTSPHTQLLCSALATAFKDLLVVARTTASRSLPYALPRIIPFLSPNTAAEMSSLFCNTGICQLGGNKESIHWAGDRRRASGKALWGDRKHSLVKLWTPPELLFVFGSDRTGDGGLPRVDRIFSWGRRAGSGLVLRTSDLQKMALLPGQPRLRELQSATAQLGSLLLGEVTPIRSGFIFTLTL